MEARGDREALGSRTCWVIATSQLKANFEVAWCCMVISFFFCTSRMGAAERSASRQHPSVVLRTLHSQQWTEAQELHLKHFAKLFNSTYVFFSFCGIFYQRKWFFFSVTGIFILSRLLLQSSLITHPKLSDWQQSASFHYWTLIEKQCNLKFQKQIKTSSCRNSILIRKKCKWLLATTLLQSFFPLPYWIIWYWEHIYHHSQAKWR